MNRPLSCLALLFTLVACGGEPAPAPPAAPPPAMDLTALKQEAEKTALVPSPSALQASLTQAGVTQAIEELVPARSFTFDPARPDMVAVQTGVLLADAILTVRSAPADVLAARLTAVKAGMKAMKAGEDIDHTLDELIAQAGGPGPRDALVTSLEELHGVMIPELQFEAGDQIVPLILAGGWLEGSNLTTGALLKAGKGDAAGSMLQQGPICAYFLKYVDIAEKAHADDMVVKQLRATMTALQAVAQRPAATAADVQTVHDETGRLLTML